MNLVLRAKGADKAACRLSILMMGALSFVGAAQAQVHPVSEQGQNQGQNQGQDQGQIQGQIHGQMHGQLQGHAQTFRGPAMVSVATLQVPESAWKHFEKARTLALQHKVAESQREDDKALAIAPRFAAAHILKASLQLVEHQYDAAVTSVIEARTSDPDAPWAAIVLAGAYNGMHRYADAVDALAYAQGAEALCWQAKYEHARAAIGLSDTQEALRWSEETMAAAPPEFNDAIVVRSNALILAQRWSEAAERLTAYLATSAPQLHREDVQRSLATVSLRLKYEPTINLASK